MSMFSSVFYFIVDHGIIEPGHGGEVVHGLNTNEKRFFFQINGKCASAGCKELWHPNGCTHWNPYI